MKTLGRALAISAVIFALLTNALPCGPSYVTPIFENESSPEDPYSNFAAGDLGIIKPGFHRPVLYAAYRYLNGGSFSPEEEASLIQVWEADFDNKNYLDTSVTEAVQTWVEKRKEVAGKDEKTPDIYTDKGSGYEYFPNCAKNAFETATETLSDRVASHGPSDPGVVSWLDGQDTVFANCSNGKKLPEPAPPGSPDWLQKDRAYQIAAASFYSLDYEGAKHRFAEIAQDMDSPWQQTADYLVSRTLVRQASLTKDKEKAAGLYGEAEQRLTKFSSGKFAESAEKMMGLIKYRIHPKERLSELARSLMNGGNTNFRQDVIDYSWLMDRFEAEVLTAEEKRKQEEANREAAKNNTNQMSGAEYANRLRESNSAGIASNSLTYAVTNAAHSASSDYKYHHGAPKLSEDDIEINVYSDDGKENWSFYVRPDATDEDAIAAAEQTSGSLSDTVKNRIRDARQTGYSLRFSNSQQTGHDMYYGSEKMTLSLLPDYLRSDELTEWLYLYPIQDNEAYLYSLSKFRSTSSDLWLMTALSKADKNSSQLMRLLDSATRISHSSPAFQTIAYHQARLLLDLGKKPEARKLLDNTLTGGDRLTISSRNQFMALRLKLADSFDDFLKYSLRKPFAFDFDGESGTIQHFIDEEKKWYDPKNGDNKTREQYDQEVEDRFKNELLWQDRQMFDTDTISVMNEHIPISVLIDVERSPAIPDYLRERFAMAIWTRTVLLEDYADAARIAPELVKYHPEHGESIAQITNAKTQAGRQNAILYFILKNPIFTPEIQDGMGRSRGDYDGGEIELGNYFFSYNLWWCAPYESESDEQSDQEVPKKQSTDPIFLTPDQLQAVKTEQAKLKAIGDAPKYLGEKVLAWAKRSPLDRRIPESLFIGYEANGMSKYGCADNTELHTEIGAYLKSRYPQSEWTRKMVKEAKGDQ